MWLARGRVRQKERLLNENALLYIHPITGGVVGNRARVCMTVHYVTFPFLLNKKS